MTRPARSSGTPSAAASGLGRTPAPHSTVPASSVSPPTRTPDASIDSTLTPVRTSTPRSSSCARARSDSGGSNGVRIRSAISTSTTRTALRSSRLKSTARMSRDRSAIAPASSTPVGPPPTTTNVSRRCRSRGIGRALRAFQRRQHALADLQRVVEILEPGRERRPLVVAEIAGARARRHHQVVVGKRRAVVEPHGARGDVDARHLGEQHGDVALAVQRRADRIRDVRRRQPRHRHLVQQRLEQVVVQAIDHRHLDGAAVVRRTERLGRRQPAEPGADDDHAFAVGRHGQLGVNTTRRGRAGPSRAPRVRAAPAPRASPRARPRRCAGSCRPAP